MTDWLSTGDFFAITPNLQRHTKSGLDFEFEDRNNTRMKVIAINSIDIIRDFPTDVLTIKSNAGGNLPVGMASLGWSDNLKVQVYLESNQGFKIKSWRNHTALQQD